MDVLKNSDDSSDKWTNWNNPMPSFLLSDSIRKALRDDNSLEMKDRFVVDRV